MTTRKGFFKPKNVDKYKGDPTKIIYRSNWERVLMSRFDLDPNVIWWRSEKTVIPYRSPVDNKLHRYYVDFTVKIRDASGTLRIKLIEVKPKEQTIPPVRTNVTNKPSNKFLNEVLTYSVNQAKWDAAKRYCNDFDYDWHILTESEIFGNKAEKNNGK
jgi:hypothetical protein